MVEVRIEMLWWVVEEGSWKDGERAWFKRGLSWIANLKGEPLVLLNS